MEPAALTLVSNNGRLRSLIGDMKVCCPGDITNGRGHEELPQYKGIWDTGATNCVITQRVVDDLNLMPIGVTKVNGVSGEGESPVFLVDFLLPFGVVIPGLRVTLGNLPEGSDTLIGMDVITLGDFSVTNKDGKTKMSFRVPSMHEIDYVQEAENNKHLPREQRRKIERENKKLKSTTVIKH